MIDPVIDGPHGPMLVAFVRGHAYGHIALDVLMASAEARRRGVDLCLLRPSTVACEAPFLVEVAGVTRRDDPASAAAAVAWWDAHPDRDQIATRYPRHYFRRRLVREPLPARLTEEAALTARVQAHEAGVSLDAPLVAIHARERGIDPAKHRPHRDTLVRNMRVETYHDTIDALLAQGFTVVRLGDPSMTPLQRAGVVDLAVRPGSDLLQLACLLSARGLIASESGPSAVALLTNTPTLTVNATDPISSYPVRPEGRLLLKEVIHRRAGRPVSLLTLPYLAHLRDTTVWEYHDNRPAEIAEAVEEFLAPTLESPEQAVARRAAEACATCDHISYLRKWGAEDGFLGDGWLCQSSAAFHASVA